MILVLVLSRRTSGLRDWGWFALVALLPVVAVALLLAGVILVFSPVAGLFEPPQVAAAAPDTIAATTTIIIAQRINSVLSADQIIVLDGGHISASGPHEELMETSAIYREIYESQLGNGIETQQNSRPEARHATAQ